MHGLREKSIQPGEPVALHEKRRLELDAGINIEGRPHGEQNSRARLALEVGDKRVLGGNVHSHPDEMRFLVADVFYNKIMEFRGLQIT